MIDSAPFDIAQGKLTAAGAFWFDGVWKGGYDFWVTAVREESLGEYRTQDTEYRMFTLKIKNQNAKPQIKNKEG